MRTAGAGTRGVSLVEMAVVVLIGVVLIVSLLPAAIGLLRQQRALSASVLSVETLPFLLERLGADFARASGAAIEPPYKSPSFRIVLSPLTPGDPEVTWSIRGGSVARSAVRTDAEGRVVSRDSRTWGLPGSLDLVRDEVSWGRIVLKLSIPKTLDEYLAFAPGRPTRRRAP